MSPALVERLARSLRAPVEVRETHGAWVLLSGDRALKLRKPVRLPFLDYSTPELRRRAGEEEVAVNRPLAGDLYRGVRAVLEDAPGGRVRLGGLGRDPREVDSVVEMRRFDERRTMEARLAAGLLPAEHVDAVARRLATFHAAAAPCPGDGRRAFAERVRRDLDDLEELSGTVRPALRRYAEAALRRRGAVLADRARRGLRRDGHGDLRAEHVVLDDGVLRVVDRLEFDPALRCADVGSDLAFLAMDLERLGARWGAERLAAAYARAGGDPGAARLRALFAWQRAIVRAKVAAVRGDAAGQAALLELAAALAWRERLPGVLLVAGPPASGKSTLAEAVGRRAGVPVVSSDVVRKSLHGARLTDRLAPAAYAEAVSREVYRELGRRAARARRDHGGVVVDATARSRALRAELTGALDRCGPLVAAVCAAPPAVLRERAGARLADAGRVSDAGPAVAAELAAAFEPVDAEPGIAAVVAVPTDATPAAALDALAAALDGPAVTATDPSASRHGTGAAALDRATAPGSPAGGRGTGAAAP